MKNFSFTKNFKIALMVPAVIIVISLLLSIFGLGINLGVDFTGGSLITYDMGGEFNVDDINASLKEVGIEGAQVSKLGDGTTLQVRLQSAYSNEEYRTNLYQSIKAKYENVTFAQQEFVGAIAGRTLVTNAIWSVIIVAICMLIYVGFRFDLRSGIAAVAALIHDVAIMCCCMVLFRGAFQANSSFIAALLTIVGYSINDTIVIFDRIRENSHKTEYKALPRAEIVDISLHETFTRTMNTTVTTLLTIVCLFIFGGSSIREFAFPIICGLVAGTYSSVMLSGQFWAYIVDHNWLEKKNGKKTARA